jgi:hypothetical protein
LSMNGEDPQTPNIIRSAHVGSSNFLIQPVFAKHIGELHVYSIFTKKEEMVCNFCDLFKTLGRLN